MGIHENFMGGNWTEASTAAPNVNPSNTRDIDIAALRLRRGSDDMGSPRASGSTSAFRSSSSWGSVSVNDLRPPSRTTNAARRERIQRFNVFQAASDRARGDARHKRHRGDAAISRGLCFRRSEKPPLPFVEMRQHRRVALLERIFIDHPQELRRAMPAWNPPSHALKPDPIQLLSDGPLVSVTAYHSFGGEVEASNTPTIRRLTPSCRHQLPRIAPRRPVLTGWRPDAGIAGGDGIERFAA
jgi:hypothetical protein